MSKRRRENHDGATSQISLQNLVHPDFLELSRHYPAFRLAYEQVLERQKRQGGAFSQHVHQDFTVSLTQALLHLHFKIRLTQIPMQHLCPPIPNRFYYVHWLQTQVLALDTTTSSTTTVLDIGTGATAIYALLWAATDPQCRVIATDIDAEAVALASQNVSDNGLSNRIRVTQVAASTRQSQQIAGMGPLATSLASMAPNTLVDVVMVNPPFYDTIVPERLDGRDRTRMTTYEGSYPGGEVSFCVDMMRDSLLLRNAAPRWCSCMVSRKTSLVKLQHILIQLLGRAHVVTGEFDAGSMTRWFLAWTTRQTAAANAPRAQGDAFEIAVSGVTSQDLTQRVVEFGNENNLQVATNHSNILDLREAQNSSWGNDHALPSELQHLVTEQDRFQRTPQHFLVKVKVRDGGLHCQSFWHTYTGQKLVTRLEARLPGELQRNNRKWRRRLGRQDAAA